jgi:predicted NAD/FAD-binding protein
MLAEPSEAEREVLGAIGYCDNDADLHTDRRMLPRRRAAWASWNVHLPAVPTGRVTVTYHMNRLQSLDVPQDMCVTLNRRDEVDPGLRLRSMQYAHPQYTAEALKAQTRWAEISGQGGVHYCGAYWGYGFHEDGVNSALAVARQFGMEL